MLPNNEYTFAFKRQGDVSKEWYEGTFVVKCVLTNSEQIDVAIRTDRYNAGAKNLGEHFKLFNRTMAELDVRIVKSPHFWKENNGGWELLDANIIYEVFAEAMKGQTSWSERLKERVEEAEKAAEKNPKKAKKDQPQGSSSENEQ